MALSLELKQHNPCICVFLGVYEGRRIGGTRAIANNEDIIHAILLCFRKDTWVSLSVLVLP